MSTLKKKIVYDCTITLKTGLHIGGTNAALNIGGPDKFVVRNPLDNIPYIPGSSLKGKLRSLVELKNGCFSEKNGNFLASTDPNSLSGALFGVSSDSAQSHPSRIIIRDAKLDETSVDLNKTEMPYTESKTEVAIDRVTAKANPRTFERVPAGARFNLSMVLNVFDDDDENKLRKTLKQAIDLLQDDYLGGQGSRGYGQVEIKINEEVEKMYPFE
ncbi:MAG TPA: type III-A CRISPR-associated RAMP protein Csm3 [Dysgonamonadaceae bacterium]|jgi:CRISPR-associated protein Csm3|nr:type III-A CRISPR-associated RAMP protein Csm3 [Dysgonamonadaceae bacterium]